MPKIQPYQFEPAFERAVALYTCSSRRFYEAVGRHLEVEALAAPAAQQAIQAAHLINRETKQAPGSTILVMQRLRRMNQEGKIANDAIQAVADLFDEAENTLPAEKAVLDQLTPTLKRRKLHVAVTAGMEEYAQRGDFARVRKLIDEAEGVGTTDSDGRPVGAGAMVRSFADIEVHAVRWLWKGRIPLGAVTLLEGKGGVGKSLVLTDLAARVSRGDAMPLANTAPEAPGYVLLMSAEDAPEDVIKPRLLAAGAIVSNVGFVDGIKTPSGGTRRLRLPEDAAELERQIRERGAGLVIVDPIVSHQSAGVDSHKDAEVRQVVDALADVAQRTGCAIVGIRHWRKAAGTAYDKGTGSGAYIAAARSSFAVALDPDGSGMGLLAHVKSNYAKLATTLRYRVDETAEEVSFVTWLGTSERVADDLSCDPEQQADRSAVDEAADVLQEILSGGRNVESTEVQKQAKAAGISHSTLWRAKRKLGVVAAPGAFQGAWLWSLPAKGNGVGVRDVPVATDEPAVQVMPAA